MNSVLVMLEVSQKQDYIFRSKQLKTNRWNSYDIAYVTGTEFFKEVAGELYSEEKNMVYAGGGHTVLQFNDKAAAKAFIKAVTTEALCRYDGMEMFAAKIAYDDSLTPGQNLKELTKALERKKSIRRTSFRRLSVGLEKLDGVTWKPEQIGNSSEGERYEQAPLPEGVAELSNGRSFANDFKELLAGSEENFIAVVHIDGNAMGKRVSSIYEAHTKDWDKCCEALRRFSVGIQKDFADAFNEMVAEISSGLPEICTTVPIRCIILSGDDVCFVSAGNIGLKCAKVFMEKLSVKENIEQPGKPYAACAGVALVHEKYPFFQAYRLAEQLCDSAKKFGAEIDADGRISAIDWHIEYGQLKESLSDVRDVYVNDDGADMHLRPLTVVVPEDLAEKARQKTSGYRTWEYFEELSRSIKENKDALARGKIKELRDALRQGELETEFYMNSRRITGLLKNTDGQAFKDIDGRSHCLLFDAIEIMDHIDLD